jgi:hypothetical protein
MGRPYLPTQGCGAIMSLREMFTSVAPGRRRAFLACGLRRTPMVPLEF